MTFGTIPSIITFFEITIIFDVYIYENDGFHPSYARRDATLNAYNDANAVHLFMLCTIEIVGFVASLFYDSKN